MNLCGLAPLAINLILNCCDANCNGDGLTLNCDVISQRLKQANTVSMIAMNNSWFTDVMPRRAPNVINIVAAIMSASAKIMRIFNTRIDH